MPVPDVIPIKNKDGTYSSEYTIGVSDSRLNNGRETVIPTIIAGKKLTRKEAVEAAVKSGLKYRHFDSIKKAKKYASERSRTGGATAHGFAGKEMPEKINKEKLRAQLAKAKSILRVEANADREQSKTSHHARRIVTRTEKLLGKDTPPAKKKGSKNEAAAKRRKPIEKATGTDRLKSALIGVAKRANKD